MKIFIQSLSYKNIIKDWYGLDCFFFFSITGYQINLLNRQYIWGSLYVPKIQIYLRITSNIIVFITIAHYVNIHILLSYLIDMVNDYLYYFFFQQFPAYDIIIQLILDTYLLHSCCKLLVSEQGRTEKVVRGTKKPSSRGRGAALPTNSVAYDSEKVWYIIIFQLSKLVYWFIDTIHKHAGL